jgi:hypothetical protein
VWRVLPARAPTPPSAARRFRVCRATAEAALAASAPSNGHVHTRMLSTATIVPSFARPPYNTGAHTISSVKFSSK